MAFSIVGADATREGKKKKLNIVKSSLSTSVHKHQGINYQRTDAQTD